jgi:hypothetical protein
MAGTGGAPVAGVGGAPVAGTGGAPVAGTGGAGGTAGGGANTTLASGEWSGTVVTGEREETFLGTNGVGLQHKIVIPEDNGVDLAHPLLLFLHGDTAGSYTSFWSGMKDLSRELRLIGVSVLAPNAYSWWEDPRSHEDLFLEFVENKLYTMANIDKDRVFFSGASGGTTFLGGIFIPTYGNKFRGGAVLMCGGARMGSRTTRLAPTQEFIDHFKIYFYIGADDWMLNQYVYNLMDFYEERGVPIQKEIPPGIGHCDFSKYEVLSRVLPLIGL